MNNINMAYTSAKDNETHQITLLVSADCYRKDVILAMNHLATTIGPNSYRRSEASSHQLASPLIQEFGWAVPDTAKGAALGLIKKLQRTDVLSHAAFEQRVQWDSAMGEAHGSLSQ